MVLLGRWSVRLRSRRWAPAGRAAGRAAGEGRRARRYGLSANAPALRDSASGGARRRCWRGRSWVDAVDDALDLFDLLMATKLFAKAEQLGNKAKLKSLPTLRRAAAKIARARRVVGHPAGGRRAAGLAGAGVGGDRASHPTLGLTVSARAARRVDARRRWRRRRGVAGGAVKRYGSVTGFLGVLAQIQLGSVDARQPVLAVMRRLPELVGRRRVVASRARPDSGDRLVAAAGVRKPRVARGVADHRAYVFCVLEELHRGLRRRGSTLRAATGGATRGHDCSMASAGRTPAEGTQSARSARRAGRASPRRCRSRSMTPTARSHSGSHRRTARR